MKTARFWVVAGTLATVSVVALTALAPITHGQVVVAGRNDDRRAVRPFEVLGGRGSSIGVAVRDVEEADQTRQKLASRRGAVIDSVEEDSPASKAGFKAGDIVVAFDGETVRSARQFARLVDETPPGRQVTASVVRDTEKLDLDVTPGTGGGMSFEWRGWPEGSGRWMRALPDIPAMPDLRGLDRLPDLRMEIERNLGSGALGVGVQSMTDELATYFGATDGVLVNSVRADSPAAKAGVRPGDVIASVNGEEIASPGELRRKVVEAGAGTVTLGVIRDKKAIEIKATLDSMGRKETKRRWTA